MKRILKDKRGKIKLATGITAALMIMAVISGLFIIPESVSATTFGTENYDDETTGAFETNESWYTFGSKNDGIDPSLVFSVNDTIYHGTSGKSYHAEDSSGNHCEVFYNFTSGPQNITKVTFWFYQIGNVNLVFGFMNSTGGYGVSTHAFRFIIGDGSKDLKMLDSSGNKVMVVNDYTLNAWHNITVSEINFTDNKVHVFFDGEDKGWYETRNPISGNWCYGIWLEKNGWAINHYIDDISLYTGGGNSPPTVTITSPTEGETVSGTITITGTASDSDGTVQSVEVKIDNGAWQTATGTTSWSYSWDTTGVSDGSHTIYARSYDGTDYSTEDSVTVTVNNTVDAYPSVSLSGLTSGKVTWNGTAGSTVWSNEILTITITNGSGSLDGDVDQINLTFSDLSGASGTIPDTNLIVYASVDNATWHEIGSPSNHIIYLNAMTWTWADNPFPITGDDTIYLKYKLTLGGDAGTYTATGWKVAIAHEVT